MGILEDLDALKKRQEAEKQQGTQSEQNGEHMKTSKEEELNRLEREEQRRQEERKKTQNQLDEILNLNNEELDAQWKYTLKQRVAVAEAGGKSHIEEQESTIIMTERQMRFLTLRYPDIEIVSKGKEPIITKRTEEQEIICESKDPILEEGKVSYPIPNLSRTNLTYREAAMVDPNFDLREMVLINGSQQRHITLDQIKKASEIEKEKGR